MGDKAVSLKGKKKKTDVSNRNIKKKDGKENSARKKKGGTKRDRKPSKEVFDEDEKEMEPPRTLPPFMKGVSDEQKAAYVTFAKKIFGLGVDGLLKEYAENLKTYVSQPMARVIFDQNKEKNRYKDIVCNDHTRVSIEDGKGSDYIHANYVKGEPLFNEFICTQGPMPGTIADFWRMVLHVKSYNVVMLCEVMELGKVKCEQYWPKEKGEKMTFGDVTVEHISQIIKDTHIASTVLKVTLGETTHTLRHHQWRTWPDKSVPKSSRAVLRILRTVRPSCRPVIVHCSAGVGRTGTLVAVEMCLQKLLGTGTLDLVEVCKKLRDQRMHTVQVDLQFVYLAVAVLDYGKAMQFWDDPSLNEDFAKFKAELEYATTTRGGEGASTFQKSKAQDAPTITQKTKAVDDGKDAPTLNQKSKAVETQKSKLQSQAQDSVVPTTKSEAKEEKTDKDKEKDKEKEKTTDK